MTERPDAVPPKEEPTVRLSELVKELKRAAPTEESPNKKSYADGWCDAMKYATSIAPPPSDAAPRTPDFHPDDRSTDPEDAPGGPKSQLNSQLVKTALDSVDELIHRGNRGGLEKARFELWAFSEKIAELITKTNRLMGETDG